MPPSISRSPVHHASIQSSGDRRPHVSCRHSLGPSFAVSSEVGVEQVGAEDQMVLVPLHSSKIARGAVRHLWATSPVPASPGPPQSAAPGLAQHRWSLRRAGESVGSGHDDPPSCSDVEIYEAGCTSNRVSGSWFIWMPSFRAEWPLISESLPVREAFSSGLNLSDTCQSFGPAGYQVD
jgi:hypothetical protein